jgi:hypothetical protein
MSTAHPRLGRPARLLNRSSTDTETILVLRQKAGRRCRSKLFLALALPQSQRALDEDHLFQQAFPAAKESPFDLERVVELPRTPSVLPYLLTFGDRTPSHLLERALRLRSNDAVKQLRNRLAEIGDERGCPEFRRTSVAVPVIIMPLSGPHSGWRH